MSQHQVLKQPKLAFKVISGILDTISQLPVSSFPFKIRNAKSVSKKWEELSCVQEIVPIVDGTQTLEGFP